MMKSYDQSVEINHNTNWHYNPDNPHRILINYKTKYSKL